MATPLFIATERFDPSDGKKWEGYINWAKITGLKELVSLDGLLCPHIVKKINDEDWLHIVNESFRLDYFYHLDYLLKRVGDTPNKNILGVYRNSETHITTPPGPGDFIFLGYDMIEDQTQISALTNCGGFPNTFSSNEINEYGLISSFARANEIRKTLPENNPEEPHANCEMYAIWRLRKE